MVDYAGPYTKWLQQRFTDLQRSGIKPLKPTAAASLDVRFFLPKSMLCHWKEFPVAPQQHSWPATDASSNMHPSRPTTSTPAADIHETAPFLQRGPAACVSIILLSAGKRACQPTGTALSQAAAALLATTAPEPTHRQCRIKTLRCRRQGRFPRSQERLISPADSCQLACMQLLPPCGYIGQPATCYATKFVHVSVNKVRRLALGCVPLSSTARSPVSAHAATCRDWCRKPYVPGAFQACSEGAQAARVCCADALQHQRGGVDAGGAALPDGHAGGRVHAVERLAVQL